MEKTKAQLKKEERLARQARNERKKRITRVLVWSISALFAIGIAAAIAFWPKPAPLAFAYEEMPTLGSADANVKIVEFGDYKCPACAYFSQVVMPGIKSEYIDTGKVSLSYQNWTIIAPDSYTAALAGLSIYHQSNEEFWKFYDALYKNQPPEEQAWATTDFLVEFAKRQGLQIDYDKLRTDIEQETYASELDKQNAFAERHRFSGTPTVFLNGVLLDDKVALNYDKFKAAIDKALQEAEQP